MKQMSTFVTVSLTQTSQFGESENIRKCFLNFLMLAILLIVPAGTNTNHQHYHEVVQTLSSSRSIVAAGLTWRLCFLFAPKKSSLH